MALLLVVVTTSYPAPNGFQRFSSPCLFLFAIRVSVVVLVSFLKQLAIGLSPFASCNHLPWFSPVLSATNGWLVIDFGSILSRESLMRKHCAWKMLEYDQPPTSTANQSINQSINQPINHSNKSNQIKSNQIKSNQINQALVETNK